MAVAPRTVSGVLFQAFTFLSQPCRYATGMVCHLHRWLLACALALLVAATLAVTPAQATHSDERVAICVRPDPAGLSLARVLAEAESLGCTGAQTRYGQGDFWAVSRPLHIHSNDHTPRAVRIASLWQEAVTLHIVYADGVVRRERLDQHNISRNLQLGAVIEFALPPRDVAISRLAWRVEQSANRRGVLLGAHIITARESVVDNLTMAGVYFSFMGLAAALLIYNLSMWWALRHGFQLIYCAMVGGLLLYAFTASGLLAWAWPDIANNTRLKLNYLLLSWSAGAGLMFMRAYFEQNVFGGWLGRVTLIVAAQLVLAAAFFALFAEQLLPVADLVYTISFTPVALLIPTILIVAWYRRSQYVFLYATAWLAPLISAFTRIASSLNLLPWNFWVDNSTIIAMAVEALLSSVAIAYRIRLLTLERDVAREQETLARRLADIDPLTGLLNRRAFLAKAIGRADAAQLILIDIDHFKRVNETLGHDGGDEVLRVLARTLRKVTPENGLIVRLGGEEFGILVDQAAAPTTGDILSEIRAARMPFDLRVTASIGTSHGPLRDETDWKRLYRSADRALFDAKAAGRDRAREGARAGIGPIAA